MRFGGFYDDNAPAAPSATGASVPVGVGEGRRNTFGELLSVRLDYDWLRAGGWIGTAGFSFFGTHNNSLPDFDLQDYAGSLNIVRRALVFNMPVLAGLSYTYDHVVLDNQRLLERNAVTAYGVLVESDRQLTTGQLRVDFKNYKENNSLLNAESQSGTNYLVGFLHMLRFGNDRHYLRGGYQFDYDDTDGRNYTYVGHRFLVGAQYTLPWYNIRLGYDFDMHYRNYLHANTVLPVTAPGTIERSDHEFTNIVRVEVPLPWFVPDQQLFLTGEYTGKIANSNIEVFQYQPQLRRDLLHLAVLSRSRRAAPAYLGFFGSLGSFLTTSSSRPPPLPLLPGPGMLATGGTAGGGVGAEGRRHRCGSGPGRWNPGRSTGAAAGRRTGRSSPDRSWAQARHRCCHWAWTPCGPWPTGRCRPCARLSPLPSSTATS